MIESSIAERTARDPEFRDATAAPNPNTNPAAP
jgi:hypothetical protein